MKSKSSRVVHAHPLQIILIYEKKFREQKNILTRQQFLHPHSCWRNQKIIWMNGHFAIQPTTRFNLFWREASSRVTFIAMARGVLHGWCRGVCGWSKNFLFDLFKFTKKHRGLSCTWRDQCMLQKKYFFWEKVLLRNFEASQDFRRFKKL